MKILTVFVCFVLLLTQVGIHVLVGEVARYWRHVGIGLHTKCFPSRRSAGTPTKPTCPTQHGRTPGFTSITRQETQ